MAIHRTTTREGYATELTFRGGGVDRITMATHRTPRDKHHCGHSSS